MKPTLHLAGLKESSWKEHAVRFAFGGTITVVAGEIAHVFGPFIGGVFLAFPAILPASLMLVKKHDGRRAAVDDARGATLAAIGLAAFGLTASTTGFIPCWLALLLASIVWILATASTWLVIYGRRVTRRSTSHSRQHNVSVRSAAAPRSRQSRQRKRFHV